MEQKQETKRKILIVDDSEINRIILSNILEAEYEIIEARDGLEGIAELHSYGNDISLVLLDVVMPNMDGFQMLKVMREYRWIEDIPVIMISTENSPSIVEKAYRLGVADFIGRPFEALVVHHRVNNTIMLYEKQKKLTDIVIEQIYQKEKNNSLMISILSHIVEFRNGESGLHVVHINIITEILLEYLIGKTDKYNLKQSDISQICMASSLHDIGKIAIPEEILNKPGKLTKEEFEVIKTHSAIGASMLEDITYQEEPLVKVAREICRWHHERYDGRGYPDGLVGEEIPISAQIVALADVYDALTSERVYKAAFTHEKAIDMIVNGECGVFNPLLLECIKEVGDKIRLELEMHSIGSISHKNLQNSVNDILKYDEMSRSDRLLGLLENERTKNKILADMTNEIQFEYDVNHSILTISDYGAKLLGISETVVNPLDDEHIQEVFGAESIDAIVKAVKSMNEDRIMVRCNIKLNIDRKWKNYDFMCRKMFVGESENHNVNIIGKIVSCN
jgi:response regulator RpfG family c-di-GMP phosphodiesterase